MRLTSHLFILLLFFYLQPDARAQYFERVYGNDDKTIPIFFDLTSDDGVVVLANTIDSILGTSGYYWLKLDSNGNEIWHKQVTDGFSAYGNSLKILNNDKIATLGTHSGILYQNVGEVWVLDSDGSFLDFQAFPPFSGWGSAGVAMSNSGDSAVSITIYNDGFVSNNYYSIYSLNPDLSSKWNDFVGFDGSFTQEHGLSSDKSEMTYTIAYYDNYFFSATPHFRVTSLRKHNNSGMLVLDSLYEFECPTNAIVNTSDGGTIICGTQDSTGRHDIALFRLDSVGNILWQKEYVSQAEEESNAVIQTSDSGFVVLSTVVDPVIPGQHDIMILKTNSAGDSLWSKKFGGYLNEKGLNIEEYNHDLTLLAMTNSFDEKRIYLVRTDSLGDTHSTYKIVPNGRYFCSGDTAVLQLSPTPSPDKHVSWSNGDTSFTLRVITSGNYSATITDSTGASFVSDFTPVYFAEKPDAYFAPDTITLCNGAELRDTSVSELTNTYQWNYNGVPLAGEFSPFIIPLQEGTYELIVRNFCSSDTSSSYVDSLYDLPIAPFIIAPSNNFVCEGDSLRLSFTASNGENYQWYTGDVFGFTIIPGATDSVYYAKDFGDYFVEAMNANNCSVFSFGYTVSFDHDQVNLTSNGPSVFCEGGGVELSVTQGTNYLWSTGDTTQAIIASTTGQYYVYFINDNGCPKYSDTIIITVWNKPAVFIGNDTNLCSGANLLIDAGSGFSHYLWQDNSTNQTFLALPFGPFPDTTEYYVFVTDSRSCNNSDTVMVIFDICAGTNGNDVREINVYPTLIRAGETISFNSSVDENFLVIFDNNGRKIFDRKFSHNFIFYGTTLDQGVYFYRITSNDHDYHGKFIILE